MAEEPQALHHASRPHATSFSAGRGKRRRPLSPKTAKGDGDAVQRKPSVVRINEQDF
jgi:hypothetical protein